MRRTPQTAVVREAFCPCPLKIRRKQRRNVLHIAGTHGPIEHVLCQDFLFVISRSLSSAYGQHKGERGFRPSPGGDTYVRNFAPLWIDKEDHCKDASPARIASRYTQGSVPQLLPVGKARGPARERGPGRAFNFRFEVGHFSAVHQSGMGDSRTRFRNLRISVRPSPSCRIIRRERGKLHLRFWRQATLLRHLYIPISVPDRMFTEESRVGP